MIKSGKQVNLFCAQATKFHEASEMYPVDMIENDPLQNCTPLLIAS